jgi:hypothetical protein
MFGIRGFRRAIHEARQRRQAEQDPDPFEHHDVTTTTP